MTTYQSHIYIQPHAFRLTPNALRSCSRKSVFVCKELKYATQQGLGMKIASLKICSWRRKNKIQLVCSKPGKQYSGDDWCHSTKELSLINTYCSFKGWYHVWSCFESQAQSSVLCAFITENTNSLIHLWRINIWSAGSKRTTNRDHQFYCNNTALW